MSTKTIQFMQIPEFELSVHSADECSISGWIWCPSMPAERLELGLYSSDELISKSIANQLRHDLLTTQKDDGRYAFTLEIPAGQKLPENGQLELRIVGRRDPLFSYRLPSLANFDYHVDSANANVISGWIWQPQHPSKRVVLDVRKGEELIGSVVADEFRADLRNSQKSDGHCAFTLPLRGLEGVTPPCKISLHIRGVTMPLFSLDLTETSRTSSGSNPLQMYEYHVKKLLQDKVCGWIWQPRYPTRRILVDVKDGDKLLASVQAVEFRTDLQAAGKSDGHCGFTVNLKKLDIPTSLATISFHVRGIAAPFFSTVHKAEPKLEFNVDVLNSQGIEGWAWTPTAPNEPVGLELLSDGKVVAETVAKTFRPRLHASGNGEGKFTFRLNFPPAVTDGRMHKLELRLKGQSEPFHEIGNLLVAASGTASANHQPASGTAANKTPVREPPPQLGLDDWTAPRCTVVAMARNEAYRAHATMRHFCALFDRIIVIDHLSDDDTAAIVAGYRSQGGPEIILLRSEEPGYLQSQYMTAATDAVLRSGEGNWLFYLDFDEFLPFTSKQDFHQALVQHAESTVISGPWINCATDLSNPEIQQRHSLKVSQISSPYLKVGINLKRLQGQNVVVEQGNHAVRIGGSEAFTGASAFGFYHIPVLSEDQLVKKLEIGMKAYECLVDRRKADGFHWYEMKRHLEQGRATPQFLDQLQLRYGEPLIDVLGGEPRSSRPIQLVFAMVAPMSPAANYDAIPITHDTLSARLLEQISSPRAGHPPPPLHIPACYSTLVGPARITTASEREEIARRALLTSSRELELVVPSAWAGHEPFLFSLMEAMKPRRYVELGTHAGQSFFTACQHYKSEGNYGEAVAIDLWEGDHQAGFYDEGVFKNFRYLLNTHFPACGRYIRSLFSDAVAAFEDSSIDLLHIDGLHTYDAVRLDYETWRPKVTDCGVILFHDTTEYHMDFGVWQFFQEIRGEAAASFNFQHSHGLGVMAFGTEDTNPAVALLREFSSAQTLYERHYSNLGKVIFRSTRFRYHEPR